MKSWSNEIAQHIQRWSSRLGNLGWWPKYIYHFTDVQNAARILNGGVLYSRAEAEKRGIMLIDNASREIIAQTRAEHLNYVRLYFRPKTPTQFRNEGIRPRAERVLDSHCPVPIYFCFDALDLLSQDQVEFSNGNMASPRVEHSDQKDFFLNIPFHYVFHNSTFHSDARDEIVFRRNAEVLVPEKLNLMPSFRFIACRSVAERQTLLNLLQFPVAERWKDRIRLGEQGFFERKWTHVEEVVVFNQEITFRFNPNTQTPGPFNVRIEYREKGSNLPRIWQKTIERLDASLRLRIPNAIWGEIRLFLDDALAYSDIVLFEDIPF